MCGFYCLFVALINFLDSPLCRAIYLGLCLWIWIMMFIVHFGYKKMYLKKQQENIDQFKEILQLKSLIAGMKVDHEYKEKRITDLKKLVKEQDGSK